MALAAAWHTVDRFHNGKTHRSLLKRREGRLSATIEALASTIGPTTVDRRRALAPPRRWTSASTPPTLPPESRSSGASASTASSAGVSPGMTIGFGRGITRRPWARPTGPGLTACGPHPPTHPLLNPHSNKPRHQNEGKGISPYSLSLPQPAVYPHLRLSHYQRQFGITHAEPMHQNEKLLKNGKNHMITSMSF